jgi:hypothetical protein
MSAPIEMKIGELAVKLSPLTLDDLASFENWIRSERLRLAQESLGAVSGIDRALVIKEVLSESVDVIKEMVTIAGTCRLLWLCAVKNDGALAFDTFSKAVTFEDLASMQTLLDKLALDIEEGNEPDRPTEAGPTGEKSK